MNAIHYLEYGAMKP